MFSPLYLLFDFLGISDFWTWTEKQVVKRTNKDFKRICCVGKIEVVGAGRACNLNKPLFF